MVVAVADSYTAFINTKAKASLKIIPFLFGIIGGYIRLSSWARIMESSSMPNGLVLLGIILTHLRYERILPSI